MIARVVPLDRTRLLHLDDALARTSALNDARVFPFAAICRQVFRNINSPFLFAPATLFSGQLKSTARSPEIYDRL